MPRSLSFVLVDCCLGMAAVVTCVLEGTAPAGSVQRHSRRDSSGIRTHVAGETRTTHAKIIHNLHRIKPSAINYKKTSL